MAGQDREVFDAEPTEAITAMQRAEIDQLVSTAKRYPRDVARCKQNAVELATMDLETAESCFYTLSRQNKKSGEDKPIIGPSIRCGEIVASTYGNLRYGSRVMGNNGKTVKAQAFCHDMENNIQCSIESDRRITTKDGRTYGDDMIVVTGNAAAAIARRNSLFGAIPKSIINAVYKAAMSAVKRETGTIKERWAQVIEKFEPMGVGAKALLKYLDREDPKELRPDDFVILAGIYNAIHEGERAVEQVFGESPSMEEPKAKPSKAKAKRKAKKEPQAPKPPEGAEQKEAEVKRPAATAEVPEDPIEAAAVLEEKLPGGAVARAREKVGVSPDDMVGDLTSSKAAELCLALTEEALDAGIE